MSCELCRVWKQVYEDQEGGFRLGQCRVRSPSVYSGPIDDQEENPLLNDPLEVRPRTVWPVTYHNDWCGEFRPQEFDL